MISAVTGEISEVLDDRVLLSVGPIVLELLVPASEVEGLRLQTGAEVMFHTLMYLEGDSSGGNSEPRLLGFLKPQDKKFFEKFITVKGIGPKKAMRAFAVPSSDIAAAIEGKDTRKLSQLPGIGKRTAEQIVAELSGKVQLFISPGVTLTDTGTRSGMQGTARTPAEEDAILTLMTLGERRSDAEALLERARTAQPAMAATDALVRVMLQMRGLKRGT